MASPISSVSDPLLAADIDQLYKLVNQLIAVQPKSTVQAPQESGFVAIGQVEVRTVDLTTDLFVDGIEFDSADGLTVTENGNIARIDRVATATTPAEIASASSAGTGTKAANEDHTHKGVHSLAKSAGTLLYGDVTLSEGANVTLTQVGQNIAIASTGGAGTPTPIWRVRAYQYSIGGNKFLDSSWFRVIT